MPSTFLGTKNPSRPVSRAAVPRATQSSPAVQSRLPSAPLRSARGTRGQRRAPGHCRARRLADLDLGRAPGPGARHHRAARPRRGAAAAGRLDRRDPRRAGRSGPRGRARGADHPDQAPRRWPTQRGAAHRQPAARGRRGPAERGNALLKPTFKACAGSASAPGASARSPPPPSSCFTSNTTARHDHPPRAVTGNGSVMVLRCRKPVASAKVVCDGPGEERALNVEAVTA
jgi:hypothetical protein